MRKNRARRGVCNVPDYESSGESVDQRLDDFIAVLDVGNPNTLVRAAVILSDDDIL